jgi:hypothetical protein
MSAYADRGRVPGGGRLASALQGRFQSRLSGYELVNIQNVNGQAKPYQIRQFFKLVEKYNPELRPDR